MGRIENRSRQVYHSSMATKKTDITSIGASFLPVAAAILIIYCLCGMTAAHLNAVKLSVMFGLFVSYCVFYAVSRIKDIKTGLFGLAAGVPCGFISYFALNAAFDSVNRMTIECFGIMLRFLLFGGAGCVALTCILLVCAKSFRTEDAVFAVLAAGFVLRAVLVIFTPLNFFQHDVSGFGEGFQGFHDDYIMYIYRYWSLPGGDVRDLGQLYHPPLSHALSAVFLKINLVIFPGRINEINVLKTLPFLYASGFVLICHRIMKHFRIDGAPLVIALSFISFHPQLLFLSIQINNDALMMVLFAASVCLALKWYEKPELTTILFTALAIGCAMMAKLSAGLVAFPAGFLFLCRFIKALKEKDGKSSVKAGELIKQFVLFALLVFPLGLWFPLKNFLLHGTPFTYVFTIDSSAHQDLWMFPAWQRIFAPSSGSLKMPFMTMVSSKPAADYNIFLSLLKTSLFDERNFESGYLINTGRVMLVLAAAAMLICIICAACVTFRLIKQKKMTAGFVSLLILCAVLLISYVKFCFDYPVACTESFRYVAPVLPAAGVFLGMALQDSRKKMPVRIIVTGVIILFICSVFAFYGSYAGYRPVWETFIKPA